MEIITQAFLKKVRRKYPDSEMVTACCVLGCRNEAYGGCGVSFFRFPKKADIRQRWIEVVPRKNKKLANNTSVCDQHFKPEDKVLNLKKAQLKPNAVPCIFPAQGSQQIFQFKVTQSPHEEEPEKLELRNTTSQNMKCDVKVTPSQIKQIKETSVTPEIRNESSPKDLNEKYVEIPLDCLRLKILEKITSDFSTQTYVPLTTPRVEILTAKVKTLNKILRKRTIAFNKLRSLLRLIKHKCKNDDDLKQVLALKYHQIPQNFVR